MILKYGLTIDNERSIIIKAKSKKDGVYRFRGVAYRVLDGNVTHLSDGNKILERAYGFNVVVFEFDYSGLAVDKRAQKVLKSL